MAKNFKDVFSRYKTYDDTHGRGSVEEWKSSFNSKMNSSDARKVLNEEDPVTLLGFSQMPTLRELNLVYRKLMMTHHPDRGGDPILCKKIIAAYTILENRLT